MAQLSSSWYAVYTRSRNEKKVAALLERSGIEHYLPLLKTLKQWTDRKKLVTEPLFRSYIFVHITEKEHLPVLQTPGVVGFVSFERKKVVVPVAQILAIKEFLGSGDDFPSEDTAGYTPGKKVRVIRGAMKGLEGVLTEVQGKQRVRVQIEAVNQSVYIAVPKSSLEIIGEAEKETEKRWW